MTCQYPYEDFDADVADVWQESEHVARKRHRCCECGGSIKPGWSYSQATCLYDGRWSHMRRCPSCVLLVEMVATAYGVCPLWEGLYEFIDGGDEDFPRPGEWRKQWEGR